MYVLFLLSVLLWKKHKNAKSEVTLKYCLYPTQKSNKLFNKINHHHHCLCLCNLIFFF